MYINGILSIVSVVLQIYFFNSLYRTIRKTDINKPRLILLYFVYSVIIYECIILDGNVILLLMLGAIMFFLGTFAFTYNSMDRLVGTVVLVGIMATSYIMGSSLGTMINSYINKFFIISSVEFLLFIIIKSVAFITEYESKRKIYVLFTLYFLFTTTIFRILLMNSEYSAGLIISFVLVHFLLTIFVEVVIKLRRQSVSQYILNERIDSYKNELQLMETSNNDIRNFKHDISNHLEVLKNLIAMGQSREATGYIERLQENIENVRLYAETGNHEIDSIINSKLSIMKGLGINFFYRVSVPEQLCVDAVDVVVILGNVLDNATRAVMKLKNKEGYQALSGDEIKLDIRYDRGQLVINIINNCEYDEKIYNYDSREDGNIVPGFLLTDKNDKRNHGLGLGNVIAKVKKYNGYIIITKGNGKFEEYIQILV